MDSVFVDEHNSKNSLDVEYVRNVIASHLATEGSAGANLQDTIFRSFENSPKLFNRTFTDAKAVNINGEETAVYMLEIRRFTTVMDAIAYAIYYKLHGHTYQGSWGMFSPSLVSQRTLYQGLPDDWERYRHLLSKISYNEIPTPQAEIFRLGVHQFDEERFIYAFMFYGGFMVNCLGLTPSPLLANKPLGRTSN